MLKYYYGTMASGKSATLLMNAYQKRKNGVKCLILKPSEERDGAVVSSRVGLKSECTVFYPEDDLFDLFKFKRLKEGITEIYVDECQFLTKEQVHQLWLLSRGDVTVNCFGLMTTYKNELFTAIQTMIVYADSMIKLEPTCTCKYCDEDATTHLLMIDGKPVLDFPEKVEGDTEGDIHFECVCIGCWLEKINENKKVM